VGDVDGLNQGVYHYEPHKHELLNMLNGDMRADLAKAALDQDCVSNSAVNIVFAAIYERTTERYGDRGKRYVHMEAGHAAQNVYLQAVALSLGTVTIGAFDDSQIKEVLNLLTSQETLYIMPGGRK